MVAVISERNSFKPSLHKFSVADYHALGEQGILPHDARTELINGEILDMSPIGARHSDLVDHLNELLVTSEQGDFKVRIQNPVTLGDASEPQPDVALVRRKSYQDAHPGPDDLFLIIEVAETTAAYDRHVKSPLYATHGIPEYWLIDLTAGRLEIYREPTGSGYRSTIRPEPTETISPIGLPGLTIAVANLIAAD